jgi:hypothetical protein
MPMFLTWRMSFFISIASSGDAMRSAKPRE